MNRKLTLSTGALALAILAGCSTNATKSDVASSDGTLTIKGSTSAALETITVDDASNAAVATDSTDTSGNYTVDVNGDSVKFPLTITVIHDGDTLVTIIPAPDSAQKHEIEANLSGLTTIAARKAKHDNEFMNLTQEQWKSKIDSSTDEYMVKTEASEHQRFVLNASVCADSVITAKMDELQAKEDAVKASKDSLEAQLKAGTIDHEAFIKALDSLFGDIQDEGMNVGQSCEPRFAGAQDMMGPMDSERPEMPAMGNLPVCTDSARAAIGANIEAVTAEFKAGTLTEDAFLAALAAVKPDCALGAKAEGNEPIMPTHQGMPTEVPAAESSSSADISSSSAL